MNRILKYVSAGFVPLVLILAGCTKKPAKEQKLSLETLTGTPVAVEKISPTQYNYDFYVVLETEKGRVYCESTAISESWRENQRRAYGLIKAEQEDGDNESIELNGESNRNQVFRIKCYTVNGKTGSLP